jgi:hypothetical protein
MVKTTIIGPFFAFPGAKRTDMKRWMMAAAIIAAMGFAQGTNAQSMGSSYKTALGVKFWPGAVTVKHFVKNNRALEGLGYFWEHGFRFTGLYEFHGDINGAPGLKWYAGPGFHAGVYNENWHRHHHNGNHDHDEEDNHFEEGSGSFGLDGVIGLDYKFKGAPINMSLDLQPYIEFIDHPYMGLWGGLAVRFTF